MARDFASAMAQLVRDGKGRVADLKLAATVNWYAHKALQEIDPDAAESIPLPKRKRGRDPLANFMRDARICGELDLRLGHGESLRSASSAMAAERNMTPSAIREIWRKRPKK